VVAASGQKLWEGLLPSHAGAIRLFAGADSHVKVERFAIEGRLVVDTFDVIC
jgi:hypothetical protein